LTKGFPYYGEYRADGKGLGRIYVGAFCHLAPQYRHFQPIFAPLAPNVIPTKWISDETFRIGPSFFLGFDQVNAFKRAA
jgi:hypothetical protein